MIDLKEIKNKIVKKNNIYCLFIILIVFFLDRYTKLFILNNFTENTYYLNDYINLDLVWNIGIGFGLLSVDNSIIYNLITTIIGFVIIIIFYFLIISEISDKISLSLIGGGALGNFYDRISLKAVPDFIDIHYGNFHWFTFNFADVFITIGIIFFMLGDVLKKND